jgi:hypothetical protein
LRIAEVPRRELGTSGGAMAFVKGNDRSRRGLLDRAAEFVLELFGQPRLPEALDFEREQRDLLDGVHQP